MTQPPNMNRARRIAADMAEQEAYVEAMNEAYATRYFVTEGDPSEMDVVATGREDDLADLKAEMLPGQALWRAEPVIETAAAGTEQEAYVAETYTCACEGRTEYGWTIKESSDTDDSLYDIVIGSVYDGTTHDEAVRQIEDGWSTTREAAEAFAKTLRLSH